MCADVRFITVRKLVLTGSEEERDGGEKKLRREPSRIMSQQKRKSKDRASQHSMLESHSYSKSSGSRQADG